MTIQQEMLRQMVELKYGFDPIALIKREAVRNPALFCGDTRTAAPEKWKGKPRRAVIPPGVIVGCYAAGVYLSRPYRWVQQHLDEIPHEMLNARVAIFWPAQLDALRQKLLTERPALE